MLQRRKILISFLAITVLQVSSHYSTAGNYLPGNRAGQRIQRNASIFQ